MNSRKKTKVVQEKNLIIVHFVTWEYNLHSHNCINAYYSTKL